MAPRKEKPEKASADQGAAMVLEYLRRQNRPYSATDISSNLHNKVTKTAAAKYLKAMQERKEVKERVSGKQAVYHIPREVSSTSDNISPDLTNLDAQIATLRISISGLKATEKSLKGELSQYSSIRSLDELQSTMAALQSQRDGLRERIVELKTVNVLPCSEAERVDIDAQLAKWKKVSKQRKEIVKNLWELFQEPGIRSEETSRDDYWAELGCEGPMPLIR